MERTEQVCWTCLELSISSSVWANFGNIFWPIKDFILVNWKVKVMGSPIQGLNASEINRSGLYVTEIGRPNVKLLSLDFRQCQGQSVFQTHLVSINVAMLFFLSLFTTWSAGIADLYPESPCQCPLNINIGCWPLSRKYSTKLPECHHVVALSSVCYLKIIISCWTLSMDPRQFTCSSHVSWLMTFIQETFNGFIWRPGLFCTDWNHT